MTLKEIVPIILQGTHIYLYDSMTGLCFPDPTDELDRYKDYKVVYIGIGNNEAINIYVERAAGAAQEEKERTKNATQTHNPCQGCMVYEGYNGGRRCVICEWPQLQEENKKLKEDNKRLKSWLISALDNDK